MDPIISDIQALCSRDFSIGLAVRYVSIVGKDPLRAVCCRMVRLLSSLDTPNSERLSDDLDDGVFAPDEADEADELAAALALLQEPSIARIFELGSGRLTVRREISSEEHREIANYCRRSTWRTQMRKDP